MSENNRPLSPHLSVHSWQISMIGSIFHRMTGVALSLGAVAFVAWIVAVALGPEAYSCVLPVLSGPLGLLILIGFTGSLFYHLANGIRHLVWDVGYGFDKDVARRSGWFTVLVAIVATAAFWLGVLA